MKKHLLLFFVLLTSSLICFSQANYMSVQPMKNKITASKKSVSSSTTIKVPTITWGGDIATLLAEQKGIFQKNGLNVSLFREDNFQKQVERCLSGETPYLRGTMGMINSAGEALKAKGVDLVVVYQLTWSTGGDAMVVRPGKSLRNIKTVGLQLYGPHMDYAANLFSQNGRLGQISFKWLPELTLPTFDTKGKILDPVSAFGSDAGLDATMCIIPDALMLTSNGTVGTGAEGSVKGAKILLSTKTASRIIADVYAVRKDYYDANKSKVRSFVKALMQAEESLRDLRKNKASADYRALMKKSAGFLLGAPEASADAEALLGDCKFVGYNGNISFFTGKGTLRNFTQLNKEINNAFIKMGLLTNKVSLQKASWDYSSFASGLKYANVKTETKKFDSQKAAAKVEKKILAESTSWEDEGTLFVVEINFAPNQDEFSIEEYKDDFKTALEISQTYNGALIIIEGHSDPLGVMKAEQSGEKKPVLNAMKQKAKNLSMQRASNVKGSFLQYGKGRQIKIDASQFITVGFGVNTPKYSPPKTKEQWAANRRVVFRVKEVEAELDEFVPLN